MCGIVGYVGPGNTRQVLIESLKRLEYRGYDSAGIATCNGNGIELYKTRGKVLDLESIVPEHVTGSAGIGHTRWATHGVPTSINAHPHVSQGVAVVHNGIIENHKKLKSDLQSSGAVFLSETDTEVIPQMVAYFMGQGLAVDAAFKETLSRLTGSFAICMISEASPHTLFAARKGSPLVLGIGDGEYFIASDVPAVLPYTSKFVFLEDGHICTLDAANVSVTTFGAGGTVSVLESIVEVDPSTSIAEKCGYEHFMMKEIYEQADAVKNIVGEWIDNPMRLFDELGLNSRSTMGLMRLQIVACGTSYFAGLVGKYMIEHMARIPVDVDIASEYRYRNPIIEKDHTVVISITQSGETADTLAAQREAKGKGARTLTICNVVGSTASREADAVLYTRAGPEIGVASTKSFTSQLAALCLIGMGLGLSKCRHFSKEIGSLEAQLLKMPCLIKKALETDAQMKILAESLWTKRGFFYLGRGINYPIALEGALKLKELSYIHAEGYAAGEMKHGPIALVEEGTPAVVIAPINELYEKVVSNIEEIKARGARVIAVTDEDSELRGKADYLITVPATHPMLSGFVNVIPLQLLAYHIAVLKGCDVDQPRNLAKSVTVE